MFCMEEARNATIVQMCPKDAKCIGYSHMHPAYYQVSSYFDPNALTDYYIVNGITYHHIFPKIGDIIVGICRDKYTITNDTAICIVTECAYSNIHDPNGDDIKIKKINGDISPEFWVKSIFFRYATEEERRLVRR